MPKTELSLLQKLALLPSSVPDCLLDFFEDFQNVNALKEDERAINSLNKTYLERKGEDLRQQLNNMRQYGKLISVESSSLPRNYPGGFVCRLEFERAVRGLGFIVSQGTGSSGSIRIVHVGDGEYSADDLKEKLTAFYRKTG